MNPKTPQFNEAIEKILADLQPHSWPCKQCGLNFDILEGDIVLLKMLRVPPPTLCPQCRMQRRLAWRMVLIPVFYKKQCNAPGHDEKVITFYSQKIPVRVYDDKYYMSDAWDPLEFGRAYTSGLTFFEQMKSVIYDVPHQTLQRDLASVNCEYTISGKDSKNCYFVAVPWKAENAYYGYLIFYSRNCIDNAEIDYSEQCYGCVYAVRCYNCQNCIEVDDCLDSFYLYDSRNSSNCFMSSNLRNAKYVFRNQQLSKNVYEQKIKEINFGSRLVREELWKEFEALMESAIHRNVFSNNVQNSVGDMIENCRNCYMAFRSTGAASDNARYIWSFLDAKDVMDIYGTTNSERLYDGAANVSCRDVKFSLMIRTGVEMEYCIECSSCEYCFGCVGLKEKKYCIFNKQYKPDQYWKLVDQIKTEMLARGEYGEFFPIAMSPHPYADSSAQMIYPLTKEEIVSRGWRWEEPDEEKSDLSKFVVLSADQVPDDSSTIDNGILDRVLLCQRTVKPFRITKFELEFYRANHIPLPILHPVERLKDLLKYRRPFFLYDSVCTSCASAIKTIYDPSRKLNVYCETCYKAAIS